jgi:hypothetical protein
MGGKFRQSFDIQATFIGAIGGWLPNDWWLKVLHHGMTNVDA